MSEAGAIAGVGTGARSRRPPALAKLDAGPDLSCDEVIDMDAVMSAGEAVRTPICRFLVPCWPEGVEGFEEAGGWRRLGGNNPTRRGVSKR